MSAAKTKVDTLVKENPVVVFSKSYCPYCRATKSLLAEQGANAHVLELDEIDDGSAIQEALAKETGQRTVPSVWIGGEFIGGNSDLQKITNKLPQMLKNAGAL